MAVALSQAGAKLILSGRNMDRLEEVKANCQSKSSIHLVYLDLENENSIQKSFEENDQVREVDILINNAGISQRSFARDTELAVYEKLMKVDYLGTVSLSLKMLKIFQEKGHGHFVVISSMAGKFGVPLRSGYSAAKMALHGFFESLRAETIIEGLNITMVCPGFVRTNISINAITGDGSQQGSMDDAQDKGMTPEEFAKEVLPAIASRKAEVLIGGFRETTLAAAVHRLFPGLFRKIIRRSKVT